eukprot:COSAG02_NODE_732_length_17973_cov_6.920275_18_plen_110_part_00
MCAPDADANDHEDSGRATACLGSHLGGVWLRHRWQRRPVQPMTPRFMTRRGRWYMPCHCRCSQPVELSLGSTQWGSRQAAHQSQTIVGRRQAAPRGACDTDDRAAGVLV